MKVGLFYIICRAADILVVLKTIQLFNHIQDSIRGNVKQIIRR